jgi:hypothetical protein
MTEHEELPAITWRARLTPTMDRRDQLRLYTAAVSQDAAKRQVRLTREALPKRKRAAN